MKKIIWSEDVETIRREIDLLVQGKTGLVCARRGLKNSTRLPAVAKTSASSGEIFVLHHPHEPSCNSDTCTFYYHRQGNPIRFFTCKRIKKAGGYVGFELPKQIYYIHRRKYDRVTPFYASDVTFSLPQKQRVYNGVIEDIAIQGAKILVSIPQKVAVGTTLCHVSINLCLHGARVQTVIFAPEAEIIWSQYANFVTSLVGIRFFLAEKHAAVLAEYIDLRLIVQASEKDGQGNEGVTDELQSHSALEQENPFSGDDSEYDKTPLF
nr:PilZ domain-containing protein [Desulfobulbaceae bacterium]